MKKFLIVLYKIFFIWLLIQFFLQTVATFQFGLDQPWMQYIWLWKEGILAVLILLSLILIIKERRWKQIFINKIVTWRTIVLVLAIGVTALLHLQVLNLDLGTYILAFKYDFFWFIILLAWFHSSAFIEQQDKQDLLVRYAKVLKWSLILALLWYAIIFIKPWTLKLVWYNNFVFEGTVGSAPPAAYYTQINRWLTRNQFLFERPISRWFFLTALFPFFFVMFLHNKPLKETWWWRSIYTLNIILTFSRAARWAWIIQLFLLWIILYWKDLRRFFRKILIPLILVFGVIGYVWYSSIFDRQYSNTGHIEMIQLWLDYRVESPLVGWWWSSAWPWSHRESERTLIWEPFNPENQFLQIMIEFGIIWFVFWFFIYFVLNIIGLRAWRDHQHNRSLLLLAVSVGMIWLSASGMVLHSFTDRMIVYPYMLLFGIIWMNKVQFEENVRIETNNWQNNNSTSNLEKA